MIKYDYSHSRKKESGEYLGKKSTPCFVIEKKIIYASGVVKGMNNFLFKKIDVVIMFQELLQCHIEHNHPKFSQNELFDNFH